MENKKIQDIITNIINKNDYNPNFNHVVPVSFSDGKISANIRDNEGSLIEVKGIFREGFARIIFSRYGVNHTISVKIEKDGMYSVFESNTDKESTFVSQTFYSQEDVDYKHACYKIPYPNYSVPDIFVSSSYLDSRFNLPTDVPVENFYVAYNKGNMINEEGEKSRCVRVVKLDDESHEIEAEGNVFIEPDHPLSQGVAKAPRELEGLNHKSY